MEKAMNFGVVLIAISFFGQKYGFMLKYGVLLNKLCKKVV